MSCGNGCGCCSKCGCRATCTCNQSMCFDETMDDFSYSVDIVAGETGKCGANCDCPASTRDNEGFSTGRFSAGTKNAAARCG